MRSISLTVNGRRVTQDVDAAMPLLYLLTDDLALRGPKLGCGLAQCGACTVIANGAAIPSCVTPVGTLDGADITTLEGPGLDRDASSDPAGVHRRAGLAVRVLPQRRDPDGQGVSRSEPARDRRADPRGALQRPVPLRRERAHAARDPAVCRSKGDGMSVRRPAIAWRSLRPTPGGAEPRGPARRSSSSIGRVDCVASAPWGPTIGGTDAAASAQGMNGPGNAQLDSWIAVACRRPGDGLHGQVRAGAGPLHGADAAHRRRARRAARSRHVDPVRYRIDARPGDDVGRAVASCQLQSRQPRAGRRHRARSADAAGVRPAGRSGRSPGGPRRRDCRRRRSGATRAATADLVGGRRVRPRARCQRRRDDLPRTGPCSARPSRVSTFPRWRPGGSSSCTTCASTACCTAPSSGRRA